MSAEYAKSAPAAAAPTLAQLGMAGTDSPTGASDRLLATLREGIRLLDSEGVGRSDYRRMLGIAASVLHTLGYPLPRAVPAADLARFQELVPRSRWAHVSTALELLAWHRHRETPNELHIAVKFLEGASALTPENETLIERFGWLALTIKADDFVEIRARDQLLRRTADIDVKRRADGRVLGVLADRFGLEEKILRGETGQTVARDLPGERADTAFRLLGYHATLSLHLANLLDRADLTLAALDAHRTQLEILGYSRTVKTAAETACRIFDRGGKVALGPRVDFLLHAFEGIAAAANLRMTRFGGVRQFRDISAAASVALDWIERRGEP